jgi:hypothetical protein
METSKLLSHEGKQEVIKAYQKQLDYHILVETGTYRGGTVADQIVNFKQIYSIELGKELFEFCRDRFKDNHNVILLNGSSPEILPQIMAEINEPAIFWLDAHFSAGDTTFKVKWCPTLEELEVILKASKHPHLILIDDARDWYHANTYPTIDELREFINQITTDYTFELKDDIIRIKLS